MKRGAIVISQELLTELLKGRMPDDFRLFDIEFDGGHNLIKFHGYSEDFHETVEGNLHMNEANDGWIQLPLKNDDYAPAQREKYKGYGIVRNLDGIKKPWWKFW